MTSLLTREDELILRSRIRRRHAIEEAMQELGYSTPGELGPDAERDWHEGQESSRCFANYALPAIRKISCDMVDSCCASDNAKIQEMNRAYAAAEALAWSNTNIPSFMDAVLNIDLRGRAFPHVPVGSDEAPDWEKFAVSYGTMGRYPTPLYGRETTANIDECIDVIADSFIFARSLATIAPPDIVKYVISSLGLDRGYPRDTVEIIEHLGIRPNVERARKKAAQSILSNPDLCDHMRVNAESWYLRFGMDPKEIMDVSL